MKTILYGVIVILFAHAAWAKPVAKAKKLEFEIDLGTSTVRLFVEKLGKKQSFEVTIANNREMLDPSHHFVMQTKEHVINLSRGVHFLQYTFIDGKKTIPENDVFVLHLEEAKQPGVPEKPKDEDAIATSEWQKRNNSLTLGLGVASVDYTQQIPTRADLTYQDFRVPAYYLEGKREFSPTWAGTLSMRMGKGGFDNSAVAVDTEDYNWSILSADAYWTASNPENSFQWGVKGGLSQQSLPFLHIDSIGNPRYKGLKFVIASLGVWTKWKRNQWSFEGGLDYQNKMSVKAPSGDEIELGSPMFLDIWAGARYHFSERWEAGLFMFTQYHKYSFTYHDGTIQSTGDLNVMYTTFDARLGWYF